MNEKPEENKALDLSALDFGPSWARQGEGKSQKKHASGNRRREGGGGKRREDGERSNSKFSKSRSHSRKDSRRSQRPAPVAPAEGVAADVMPIEEGIDNLVKEIVAAGRTYSVFDLARMILSARERYKVVFRKEEQGPDLFQCRQDGAVFLTQAESLAHAVNAEWFKEYYTAEEVESEAPSGNFQAIGKCGFSGALFGPPNYHAYNQNIVDLHQAEFGNMDLERYKSRIVVEKGEEAVNAWLESMKRKIQYRSVADAEVVLEDKKATLAHFEANGFGEAFHVTARADVDSQIPGKLLSPSLLSLLKETIADQRRYPGKLAPFLCRQFSGRHLAVFKWQGKLHCGPSRPHALAEETKLAERPEAMLQWISNNAGAGVDALWQAVLPAEVTEEVKQEWFHDLHWMINQGFVILMSNGHIFTSADSKVKNPESEEKKAE